MVKVKATRDHWLASTSGHSIDFKAGGIYDIPDVLLTEAVLAGAIPVDQIAAASPEVVAEPASREALIRQAVEAVVAENEYNKFTMEGFPRVSAVMKHTGFSVVTADIQAAMNAIKADIAES